MQALKDAIINSPALISIDYSSDRPVYLSFNSSVRGVGWILSQECPDGTRRPSRFGSISWNERESRYSQAKLELYGLFRALRALRLHIVGTRNLVVEMDASFICGMLNNPDCQPNATINRWIAAIHLFDFKLVHIPAEKHHGPDGLSRRAPVEGEDADEDDPEDWIDATLALGVWVLSGLAERSPHSASSLSLKGSESAETPTLPSTDHFLKANDDIASIAQYLRTLKIPSHLPDAAPDKFLCKVKRFSLVNDRLWRLRGQGRHQLYIAPAQRLPLIRDAHDHLGHKGFYSTHRTLFDCFWWPSLRQDIKWYIGTCHECQLRQTTKVCIPPVVDFPAPLFRKVYIDTMFMPLASGFRYIVQARCSLSAWPEWRALRTETGRTIGAFIFEDILCRWGAVTKIVTDNGTAYIAALDWLAHKYGIHHIQISPYNSRANGIIERQHHTICESLVKTCEGDITKWPASAPHVFWADRVTTRKSTGHSPFFIAHGVEPILPFDITMATFLVPNLTKPLATADLLAIRARQLQQRGDDLAAIQDHIYKARLSSVRQFEKQFEKTIREASFHPGTLVLVRNSTIESDLR
jgi:hypothetical protein